MTSEEALISRLSDFYVSHPTTDEASQKNVLINLAIDKRWDLQRSSSGILYHLFDTGSAKKAKWGDKVRVHYRGFSLDQKMFDSSLNRGEPFEFYVGNVIQGWNEALTMLGENGYGIFIIPAYLAYGQEGFQKKVQPNEHLIFQIKLLELLKN
jgi:FKBP-type peptidyl-prolyl cis-trans isomerase